MGRFRSSNKGQVAIEVVIAMPLLIVIIFGLIISSMSYFSVRSQSIQANYDVGRFISQMGYCNTLSPSTNGSLAGLVVPTFVNERKYKITIKGSSGGERVLNPASPDKFLTDIVVYCPTSWVRTASFRVTTKTTSPMNSGLNFFPRTFTSQNFFMVEYGDPE